MAQKVFEIRLKIKSEDDCPIVAGRVFENGGPATLLVVAVGAAVAVVVT